MPRTRISPLQKAILETAQERGWTEPEFVYRAVYGMPVSRKNRPAVSAARRAAVARSLAKLVGRGLLTKDGRGLFRLPQQTMPKPVEAVVARRIRPIVYTPTKEQVEAAEAAAKDSERLWMAKEGFRKLFRKLSKKDRAALIAWVSAQDQHVRS